MNGFASEIRKPVLSHRKLIWFVDWHTAYTSIARDQLSTPLTLPSFLNIWCIIEYYSFDLILRVRRIFLTKI